jgi:hypothetical protein
MRHVIVEREGDTSDGRGRYVRVAVSEAEFCAARRAQCEWQLWRLTQDQLSLLERRVPSRLWLYVACNSDPALGGPGATIGTWWDDASYALKTIEEDVSDEKHVVYRDPRKHAKYYAVVDGRDEAAMKRILAENWEDDGLVEGWRGWVKSMTQM